MSQQPIVVSASWEIEKSSYSIVPRMMKLEVDRLMISRAAIPETSINYYSTSTAGASSVIGSSINTSNTNANSTVGSAIQDFSVLQQPTIATTSPSVVQFSSPEVTSNNNTAQHFLVYIAVKFQNRRLLRSPPILVPKRGEFFEQELSVICEYPHSLKADNTLLLLLQRRKKYKNLGYKTVAVCRINLSQVLQRRLHDYELELRSEEKSLSNGGITTLTVSGITLGAVVARLHVRSLVSLPVERGGSRIPHRTLQDGLDDLDNSSEEDELELESKVDKGSLQLPATGFKVAMAHKNPLRQKVVDFLKRLKPNDEEEDCSDAAFAAAAAADELHRLFDELANVEPDSDDSCGAELGLVDSVPLSAHSTPRPTLRRFFGSDNASMSRDIAAPVSEMLDTTVAYCEDETVTYGIGCGDEDEGKDEQDNSSDGSGPSVPLSHVQVLQGPLAQHADTDNVLGSNSTVLNTAAAAITRRGSNSDSAVGARRETWEQVAAALSELPERLVLVEVGAPGSIELAQTLSYRRAAPLVWCANLADCRHVLQQLMSRLQRVAGRPAAPLLLLLAGGDLLTSWALRAYVELFGQKSSDWQTLLRFFSWPLAANGSCALSRQLTGHDPSYATLMTLGIRRYLSSGRLDVAALALPIGEVVLATEGTEDHCCVPFLTEVRLAAISSFANDDIQQPLKEGSPPGSPCLGTGLEESDTSPSAANVMPVELQLDYWLEGSGRKNSSKTAVRDLRVTRATNGELHLLVSVAKEKKTKIMRLGKKTRSEESRNANAWEQHQEAINRLVCTSATSKNSCLPVAVTVDGLPWPNVKFFQLSSSWQTKVKYFPVTRCAVDVIEPASI